MFGDRPEGIVGNTGGHRSAHRTARSPVVLLIAVLLLATVVAPATASRGASDAGSVVRGAEPAKTNYLPIALPSTTALRGSPRLVFAHYMPSLPVSIDNRPAAVDYYTYGYLTPNGENGKHRAYGGFLRDRPIPREPHPNRTWGVRNMEAEVRQAMNSGVDGFSLDLLDLGDSPGNGEVWKNSLRLLEAARNVDPRFKIMLMPDMASIGGRDVDTLAKYVAQLASYPSAFRLPDGRLVVSPFLAERRPVAWWSEFMSVMKSRHGISVAFVPVFLDSSNVARYASISYGASDWGARNPAWNDPLSKSATSHLNQIARVRAMGKLWMQPVSVQDERPHAGLFQEASNTTNLRNTWQIAIASKAEWVQLTTWNDYAEGTHFAPSVKHGWSYLDISTYYLTWFKTGSAPKVAQDTLYLTHRSHPVAAKPTYPQTRLMTLRGGTSAHDTVEVLAFLRKPATLMLTSGTTKTTCAAPAGVSVCTAPLKPGAVRATATRGSTAVAQAISPFPVTTKPYVQDLQYLAIGSRGPRLRTP
jgi:hypothetical protein